MSYELYHVGPEKPSCTPDPLSNRGAFLQSKAELLTKYSGKVVGFANGRLVGVANSHDSLEDQLEGRPDCLRVYVEFVDEAAFEEPPPVDMPSVLEVYPSGDTP